MAAMHTYGREHLKAPYSSKVDIFFKLYSYNQSVFSPGCYQYLPLGYIPV